MTDALIKMFTSGAYLPFALLFAYGALRLVKDDTSWLNNGRVAVIAAAVLAGLSTLVPILTTGKTPGFQEIAMALGAAYALYVSPHPAPAAKIADAAARIPSAVTKA